jgi:hypothetical protein
VWGAQPHSQFGLSARFPSDGTFQVARLVLPIARSSARSGEDRPPAGGAQTRCAVSVGRCRPSGEVGQPTFICSQAHLPIHSSVKAY